MTELFVDAGAFGDFCFEKFSQMVDSANTPAAAQDMLYYIELLAESQGKPREEAMLDYYGVSYGSTLGTTFASPFPERVGRMIIDGVMDAKDYYIGDWAPGVPQGDEAVIGFLRSCFEAGPTALSSVMILTPMQLNNASALFSKVWKKALFQSPIPISYNFLPLSHT